MSVEAIILKQDQQGCRERVSSATGVYQGLGGREKDEKIEDWSDTSFLTRTFRHAVSSFHFAARGESEDYPLSDLSCLSYSNNWTRIREI